MQTYAVDGLMVIVETAARERAAEMARSHGPARVRPNKVAHTRTPAPAEVLAERARLFAEVYRIM